MAIYILTSAQHTSPDRESLIEGMCTKAKQLDALLTVMNHKDAMGMLDEDGRADLQWLVSDLAAEAGSFARQVQSPTAF